MEGGREGDIEREGEKDEMVEGGKVTWSWFYDRRCEGSVNAPRCCTAAATGRPDVIRINVGHSDGANLTGKSSRHSQTSASFSLGRLLIL